MEEKKDNTSKNVPIKYNRAPNYQIYHADGVIGGWTPRKNLSFDFYVERGSVPEMMIHEITTEGRLGDIIERRGDIGMLRERQMGLILDVQTAIELRDWLNKKIKEGQEAGLFEIQKNNSEKS